MKIRQNLDEIPIAVAVNVNGDVLMIDAFKLNVLFTTCGMVRFKDNVRDNDNNCGY